jgi:hypothetical protein
MWGLQTEVLSLLGGCHTVTLARFTILLPLLAIVIAIIIAVLIIIVVVVVVVIIV